MTDMSIIRFAQQLIYYMCGALAPACAVSMTVAIYRIATLNPPNDKGIFCESAHTRSLVAIPETSTNGATQRSPEM